MTSGRSGYRLRSTFLILMYTESEDDSKRTITIGSLQKILLLDSEALQQNRCFVKALNGDATENNTD